MLFDMEDFQTWGITSANWDNIIEFQDNGTVNMYGELKFLDEGVMSDVFTTHRATRDSFFKSINEYYQSGAAIRPDKELDFYVWQFQWSDAVMEFSEAAFNFWTAFMSTRYLNGRNGGEEAYDVLDPYSLTPGSFKVMTQEIYDAYYAKISTLSSLEKELIELVEGAPIIY